MGREARCECRWGERVGNVTAHLETNELIVRGDIGARIKLADLERVRASGDTLACEAAGERLELRLGPVQARRWVDAIAAPPRTLAQKLGVTHATQLHVKGALDDAALSAALAGAVQTGVPLGAAEVAIFRTDDEATLAGWLEEIAGETLCPPLWVVYAKGRAASLGERRVLALARSFGFIDTKVASVSDRLTALRFVKKKPLASGGEARE